MDEKRKIDQCCQGPFEYKGPGEKYTKCVPVTEKGKISIYSDNYRRDLIDSFSLDHAAIIEQTGGKGGWKIKLTRSTLGKDGRSKPAVKHTLKCATKDHRDRLYNSMNAATVKPSENRYVQENYRRVNGTTLFPNTPQPQDMYSRPSRTLPHLPPEGKTPSTTQPGHDKLKLTSNRSQSGTNYQLFGTDGGPPSWFFEDCGRDGGETILTVGKKYGNVLLRRSTSDRMSFVIVSREETQTSGPSFRHYKIIMDVAGYKIDVDNVKHEPFSNLTEVMSFLVDYLGPAFRPMSTNDKNMIGLKDPEYDKYINPAKEDNEDHIYEAINDGYMVMRGDGRDVPLVDKQSRTMMECAGAESTATGETSPSTERSKENNPSPDESTTTIEIENVDLQSITGKISFFCQSLLAIIKCLINGDMRAGRKNPDLPPRG